DGVADARLDIADALDGLAHQLVAGMAHIDAEDVGTGPRQFLDHLLLLAGRPEGGEDLRASDPSHCLSVASGVGGASAEPSCGSTRKVGSSKSSPPSGPTTLGAPALSLSCKVQSERFWVSISKNPVRS